MHTTRKNSRKRQAILDALRQTHEHPSAEWLYARLKPEYPDLSLGTVYRNLSLFKEEGTIVSVGTVNGQERFDAITEPHTHFICSGCGSIIDLETALPDPEIFTGMCRLAGCEMHGFQLNISGLCSDCAQAHKND